MQRAQEGLDIGKKVPVFELVENAGLLVEIVTDADQLTDQIVLLSTAPPRTNGKTFQSLPNDMADRSLSLISDDLQVSIGLRREANRDFAAELYRHDVVLL